jgi:hypothetical protein
MTSQNNNKSSQPPRRYEVVYDDDSDETSNESHAVSTHSSNEAQRAFQDVKFSLF